MSEMADASSPEPGKSRWFAWMIWAFALAVAIPVGQLVLSGASEGECWIWPGIGTRFALGYSETAFAQVKPGMSAAEVIALLGQPLGRATHGTAPPGRALWQRGDDVWVYSSDTSARGGDWAWLSREVVFRDGAVVQTVRWTYRD